MASSREKPGHLHIASRLPPLHLHIASRLPRCITQHIVPSGCANRPPEVHRRAAALGRRRSTHQRPLRKELLRPSVGPSQEAAASSVRRHPEEGERRFMAFCWSSSTSSSSRLHGGVRQQLHQHHDQDLVRNLALLSKLPWDDPRPQARFVMQTG